MADRIEFNVKYAAGAYNTNQVRGQRASSTSSAEAAAAKLAQKVFQDGDIGVKHLHNIGVGLDRFEAWTE